MLHFPSMDIHNIFPQVSNSYIVWLSLPKRLKMLKPQIKKHSANLTLPVTLVLTFLSQQQSTPMSLRRGRRKAMVFRTSQWQKWRKGHLRVLAGQVTPHHQQLLQRGSWGTIADSGPRIMGGVLIPFWLFSLRQILPWTYSPQYIFIVDTFTLGVWFSAIEQKSLSDTKQI